MLKVADKQFTITSEMVEVKRFTKTVHGELILTAKFFQFNYFI